MYLIYPLLARATLGGRYGQATWRSLVGVMIAFVVGLSFGVHFMGLLTIPAIGMLYYFKTIRNRDDKRVCVGQSSLRNSITFYI